MNTLSRTLTGIIALIIGIVLILLPIFNSFKDGWFVAWIYGIPILIISFFILFNKKEDIIEQIKGGKK